MENVGDASVIQSSERYDRQIRIWGDGGQARLRDANILILGCSTTAAETLRNLVLPGIGRFVLIDDSKVLLSDPGENFLVSPEDVGDFICRVVSKQVVELNPAVYGEAWAINPHDYLKLHGRPRGEYNCSTTCQKTLKFFFPGGQIDVSQCCPPPVCKFDVVISSLMPIEDERELLRICSECGTQRLSFKEETNGGTLRTSEHQRIPPHVWEAHRQVPVVSLGSLGFFGWVRLWAGEYCLVDTKPENAYVDLRIANPFPELLEYASKFELESMDDEQHSHVPFIVILIQAVCRYRGITREEARMAVSHGNVEGKFSVPLPGDARRKIHDIVVEMRRSEQEMNFQEALDNVYRTLKPPPLCEDIAEIMERASRMVHPYTPFWRLARALHRMFVSQKALPVCPLTMDMTADTCSYVSLQRIYAEKAAKDEQIIEHLLCDESYLCGAANQRDAISASSSPCVSKQDIQSFCRNAATVKVIRYPEASEHEFGTACRKLLSAASMQVSLGTTDPCSGSDTEECGRHHLPWYAAILACKLAAEKLGRFPGVQTATHKCQHQGTTTTALPKQFADLNTDTAEVAAQARKMEELLGVGRLLSDDITKQVVGYRGSEFPTTAALIGGVAAQETIKLLCKQFEPINNTFLWNGTERRGIVLRL